jgi:hypothetical protein
MTTEPERPVMWLLIKGNANGEPITVLDPDGLRELLEDPPGNYGVTGFLDHWPTDGESRRDPAYWGEGVAMLVRADIVEPKPVQVAIRWAIDQ